MTQFKKISRESIPEALEKAERYRLLNEPMLAESICLDILVAEPGNTKAIVIMLLAVTDQFSSAAAMGVNNARQFIPQLKDEYDQHYYNGLICERQGKAVLQKNIPDNHFIAYEWLIDAMEFYEKAEAIKPAGKDDAILRWNTCARLIQRHHLKPRDEKHMELPLE